MATKSEHAGAKNRGGYWGKRARQDDAASIIDEGRTRKPSTKERARKRTTMEATPSKESPAIPRIELLRELLLETKDGDWGKDVPDEAHVLYRVIRGGDFPLVREGDVATVPTRYLDSESVRRRTLIVDDIIIETAGGNRDRPTGRTLLITEQMLRALKLPATCASFSRFMRVDPKKADPQYVYWYLQYLYARGEMWIHQVQHTGVARFQFTRFAETVGVPIPQRSDQEAMSRILCALDDKIELNRRMNRTLEAMAQAIFRSWFVDFDPVVAKADGRKPYGMDDETVALFPKGFQDSAIGPIPRGWTIAAIGELLNVFGGSTPNTGEPAYWIGGTIPWATPKDLAGLSDPVLTRTARQITEVGLRQISSGLLPSGTVLMSSRAPIGYIAIAEIPMSINQGFIGMVCDGGLPNHYVVQWLKENMETIFGRANGTTFLEISKANFRPILALKPSEPVLQRFAELVGGLHLLVVKNIRQSESLRVLRDNLLPKLLSGEIRIGEAEQAVDEVV